MALKINAKFLTSAGGASQFLSFSKPEICVAGRSNVGKSSLINKMGNNGKLAKVSKDPGRTRLVNYFDFGPFVLTDLPGYGYAKVSKAEKQSWGKLLDSYFDSGRADLALSLVDIRREPTGDDLDMINYLYAAAIPFLIVATKADKLSRDAARRSVAKIAQAIGCGRDDVVAVSSVTGAGIEDLLEKIEKTVTFKGDEDGIF